MPTNVHGRVKDCRVVKSSGYSILDKATCDLLTRRAKFSPATDEHGNPIEDVVRTPPVEWKIR